MAQRPGRADAEDSPSAPGATPVDPDLEIGPGEDVPSFAGFYSAEIARGRSRPPLKRLRRKQPDRLPVGADPEGAEGSPLRRSDAESSQPVYTSAEQAGSPLGDLVAVAEGITTRAGSPHGGPRGGVAALPELAVSPLGSARSQAAAVQADSPLGIDVGQFAMTEPAGSPRGRADEDVDMLAGQAGAPLSKSRPARERALGGSGDKGFPSLAGSPARVPKPAVLVKGAAQAVAPRGGAPPKGPPGMGLTGSGSGGSREYPPIQAASRGGASSSGASGSRDPAPDPPGPPRTPPREWPTPGDRNPYPRKVCEKVPLSVVSAVHISTGGHHYARVPAVKMARQSADVQIDLRGVEDPRARAVRPLGKLFAPVTETRLPTPPLRVYGTRRLGAMTVGTSRSSPTFWRPVPGRKYEAGLPGSC